MEIEILSLFPEYFTSPLEQSILKRSLESGLVCVRSHNIRDYCTDRHKTADDKPFGGGPGMVMKPEPIAKAIEELKRPESHVIYLSPQGAPLTAKKSRSLAKHEHLILLCGHYEGVDERIIEHYVDEEISIGDFVLTSGCVAALVLIDATIRFIPGVVGKEASTAEDSFEKDIFDHPHYTQPRVFNGLEVPQILTEGNHAKIKDWRKKKAFDKTAHQRPDLIQKSTLKDDFSLGN